MKRSTGQIERALANALQRDLPEAISPNPLPTVSQITRSPQPTSSQPGKNHRKKHVPNIATRYKMIEWMIQHAAIHTDANIISTAVRKFPQHFPGNGKANLQKASCWRCKRQETMALKIPPKRSGFFTSSACLGVKRSHFKALPGRGRKQELWVMALYQDLFVEFKRLLAAGLKFSAPVLREHAIRMIQSASDGSPYSRAVVESKKCVQERISIRWVQHFMHKHSIVLRSQTGKLIASPGREVLIEKHVAFHLGEQKRGFQSGLLNENHMANADETHFIFNMDNGKTLGFVGVV